MSFIRSPVRQVPYQQQQLFSPAPSRVSINGRIYPQAFSYQSPQIQRAPLGQPVRASMLNQSVPGFRPATLQQISQPSLARPFVPPSFIQQVSPQQHIIKPVLQPQPQVQDDKMLQTLKKENRELKQQFIKQQEDLAKLKQQEDELNEQLNQYRSQSQVVEDQ